MTLNDIMGCGLTATFLQRADGQEIPPPALARLQKLGLVSEHGPLTEKGNALCSAILAMQEPVSVTKWIIPAAK